ncbi:MAG: hypothetical protein WBQ25_17450 [Nitrososphaeraceae archaeon]
MQSPDQNFAEKDIDSLDWQELLNLKRRFSSYLKELTNGIIEIERSKMPSLNHNIQAAMDSHRLLVNKSRDVRASVRSKNSEFLAISQKISQSKDFLSMMESRITDNSEDILYQTKDTLTKNLEDKQYENERDRARIVQEIKDTSMKIEAVKAVNTIKQELIQFNRQAEVFRDNIMIMENDTIKLNNDINTSRIALDALFKARHRLAGERGKLLSTYNEALAKLEMINSKMDKIAQVRKQRVQEHGRYVSDSVLLKVKEEAKKKLQSGSKLSFEELKLLYNDGG